tara:strand:+ start:435 stop:719 length:285 start_codon:yes stop_codon:yes gene_type:complete
MEVIITPDDDWFEPPRKKNPLDDMPIAKDYDNPRPEEEIADNYASRHDSSPDFEQSAKETVTMHEKMYRIATAKYNPFAIGGSENLGGGSELVK